jgi:hydrogenase-4 component E
MMTGLFSQLCTLGASALLLTSLIPLWRRHVTAYVNAFRWQSIVLAATTAVVAYFGGVTDLYAVAAAVLVIKGLALPALLRRMERRLGKLIELDPYVNTTTSVLVSSLLVIFGYALARPLVSVSQLPTRAGMPLAVGMVFVSLFAMVTRRKAISQVIAFLMLENGIALLAILGTYGIPLIVEFGVFLDALMGFLVMQIFVYRIHETFESLDVEQLSRLRH